MASHWASFGSFKDLNPSFTEVIWRVDNFFLTVKTKGAAITSPVFTVGKKTPTRWELHICPPIFPYREGFASLLKSLDNEEMVAEHTFCIYDKEGKLVTAKNPLYCHPIMDRGYIKFMPVTGLDEEQDFIIVRCRIKLFGEEDTTASKNPFALKMALWEFKQDGQLTDVEVKVGDGRVIPCHKVLLASRSKVFKAMLNNSESLETQSSSISAEYSFECMKKLIEYIYLGQDCLNSNDEGLKDLIYELYFAADYYNMQKFKKWCGEFLVENLTVDTVFTTLEVAWKASNEELIDKCVEFFKSNPNDSNLKKFETLFAMDSVLAAYLYNRSLYPKVVPTASLMEGNFEDTLWQCFLNKEFTDLAIKCAEETILCHRVVLIANSAVLKGAILSLADTNEIEITGFSVKCLKKMMEFMYTGKVGYVNEDVKEIAVELFMAAQMYELANLKIKCEQILLEKLNDNNALDILDLAWKSNSLDLRDKVAEFLVENPKPLLSVAYDSQSQELKNFMSVKMAKKLDSKYEPLKTILFYEK